MMTHQIQIQKGEQIASNIPQEFFSNPEYNFKIQDPIRGLGCMDTETRKWFLSNLSQNDLVSWAKDYHVRARSSEVPY